MTKRSPLPSSRRHTHIFDEDWDFLTRWYGVNARPGFRLTNSCAIRLIVHQKVLELRTRQNEAIDALPSESDEPTSDEPLSLESDG